ncbi:MAG: acyltransferase [Bacteroidales bacterium]|nr:acyltransferase [Bacteroidales bacterium]MCM1147031.1 acyltransferase [Bacteroidales bacterium]MCM1205836.1 acyltransferase [Bacillota bacterium]MCM1509922.1 acyltransferase [Clostridium sp.]
MRVCAMFFIVALHSITHGFYLDSTENGALHFELSSIGVFNYVVVECSMTLMNIAVDLYVLITGYFLVNMPKAKWSKIPKIWFHAVFYSVTIAFTLKVLKWGVDISWSECLKSAMPVKSDAYWFVTKYLGLIALSPFLAKLASALTKEQYKVMLFVLCFLQLDVYKFPYGYFYENNWGTSLMFFVTLFLCGGYIRLYNPFAKNAGKNLIAIFVISLLFNMRDVYPSILSFSDALPPGSGPYHSLTFFVAIAFFVWMKNISFANNLFVRTIVRIAPYTFGVYLIHENPYLRVWLWRDIIAFDSNAINSNIFIPYWLVVITSIFCICIVIDFLRQKLFDMFKVEYAIDKLINKVSTEVAYYL